MPKLYVVGLGPGAGADLTQRARAALEESQVIAGYTTYVDLVRDAFPEKELLVSGMRGEVQRCRAALERTASGATVALVCSGDPGVYGMAGLVLELAQDMGLIDAVDVEVVAGVTAATGGAALLGAPLMHDFCLVSLSDLLTPWDAIETRLRAAARAGFVICLYNPCSHGRPDHLAHAVQILLEELPPTCVCGIAHNVGRPGEGARVLTLGELAEAPADMTSVVYVGNATTCEIAGRMVTPRGYQVRP